jgi:hypothetical protein
VRRVRHNQPITQSNPLQSTPQPPLTIMAPDLPNSEYEFRGKDRYVYPLLYVPISDIPIDVKVALVKKAIEAGDDVNQLDTIPDARRCFGRPLDFAVEYSRANFDYLKDNIPVIKLLLDHGADPRLPGPYRERSALEEMRDMAQMKISDKEPEWNKVVPFFKEAFALMDEVAKRLDGNSTPLFLDEWLLIIDAEREARKARLRAVLDRFKFWRSAED